MTKEEINLLRALAAWADGYKFDVMEKLQAEGRLFRAFAAWRHVNCKDGYYGSIKDMIEFAVLDALEQESRI